MNFEEWSIENTQLLCGEVMPVSERADGVWRMMFVLQTKKGQEVLYEVPSVAQTRSQQKLFSGSQRCVRRAKTTP